MSDEKSNIEKDFAEVASTPEGQRVFQYIAENCGLYEYGVSLDPNSRDVNMAATMYTAARRGVYLDIRRMIPRHIRAKIEGSILPKEVKHERTGGSSRGAGNRSKLWHTKPGTDDTGAGKS